MSFNPEKFFMSLQFKKHTEKKRDAFKPFIEEYNQACKDLGYHDDESIRDDIQALMENRPAKGEVTRLLTHINQLFTQCMGTLKDSDQFMVMKTYSALVKEKTIG